MPQFILIALLAATTSPAAAPPSAQCGAKPFLLHKPVPHHAPATSPGEASQKTVAAATAKPAATTAKPKPQAKSIADCDKPKKG